MINKSLNHSSCITVTVVSNFYTKLHYNNYFVVIHIHYVRSENQPRCMSEQGKVCATYTCSIQWLSNNINFADPSSFMPMQSRYVCFAIVQILNLTSNESSQIYHVTVVRKLPYMEVFECFANNLCSFTLCMTHSTAPRNCSIASITVQLIS